MLDEEICYNIFEICNVIWITYILLYVIQPKEESKNTSEARLVYMCGECSNCYSSIESCKEHMIEVIILNFIF